MSLKMQGKSDGNTAWTPHSSVTLVLRVFHLRTKKQPKKKIRVAAYARVSTGSDKQLASLDTQKRHYEQYIKARPDWDYAGLYFDEVY